VSNSNSKSVSVRILGKNYQIACPSGHEHELLDAANYLDKNLRDTKRNSRVAGSERIILMGALNIAHQLLTLRSKSQESSEEFKEYIESLNKKLDLALITEE